MCGQSVDKLRELMQPPGASDKIGRVSIPRPKRTKKRGLSWNPQLWASITLRETWRAGV